MKKLLEQDRFARFPLVELKADQKWTSYLTGPNRMRC